MDHDKSRSRDRKDFYIAPVIIALVMAALVGVIVWRQPSGSEPPTAAKQAAVPAPPKPAAIPVNAGPLLRADLLAAARRAASDYATGRRAAAPDGLKGRRFLLQLPFACNGANGIMLNPQAMASYDAAQASVSVMAQPGLWTSLPVMQPLVDAGQAETVEGFWIPRPWTAREDCPAIRNPGLLPAISTPPTAQSVGLAQIFAPGASRMQRHSEHPYSATRKLKPTDMAVLDHSYRLLLEGTVAAYPDGQAVHCWSESPDHQPICIFAVTLERVAFRDAVTGEILASWSD